MTFQTHSSEKYILIKLCMGGFGGATETTQLV